MDGNIQWQIVVLEPLRWLLGSQVVKSMIDRQDSEIEDILNAYDDRHEESESEIRRAEEAGIRYDANFRQVIASVIRPYFEEVARQLEAHGHSALVEEGSMSSPDHRLAGGSKITLAFLPKERAQQSLHHQLELNDAPHFMLRCDKLKRMVEVFQEPDPGLRAAGVVSQPIWPIELVTRDNLRARVLLMIVEVLTPPAEGTASLPRSPASPLSHY